MTRRIARLTLTAFAALVALAAPRPSAAQTPTYSVTDLGVLPGHYRSQAHAVNAHGQIVGFSQSAGTRKSPSVTRAFLWLPAPAYGLPAGMNSLGTLGGASSTATDINGYGQVVGKAAPATGLSRACVWLPAPAYGLPAGMTDLSTLVAGSGWKLDYGSTFRINDLGQVVGSDWRPGTDGKAGAGCPHAFLLDLNTRAIQDLGTLYGQDTWAYGLSNNGQVTGSTEELEPVDTNVAIRRTHVFRWDSASGMQNLGIPSASPNAGHGINDFGQIAGVTGGNAFFWDNGVLRLLGNLGGTGSAANALSNDAVVVGRAYASGSASTGGVVHAFRWDPANGMRDLNSLKSGGMELVEARGIGASGAIAGYGTITVKGKKYERAFLLTPQ